MTQNVRTKAVFVLLGTLLLGILLGALGTGFFVRHRLHHLHQLRTPSGFTQEMMQAIEPTGSEQRDALRDALQSHVHQMKEIRERYRKKLRTEVDSMHATAEDLLTPQQQQRMREKMKELHREGEHAEHEFSPFGVLRGPAHGEESKTRIHRSARVGSGME